MPSSSKRSAAPGAAPATKSLDARTMKTLAWNGAKLRVPADWDPVRLGKNYLLLEDPQGPVMECKWTPTPKRLTPVDALKRLTRESGIDVAPLADEAIRPAWKRARPGSGLCAFTWKGAGVSGLGAAFACEACGGLTVMQFFHTDQERNRPGAATWDAVLASYRDHPEKDSRRFEIYDITANVPLEYALGPFSFQPGRFELEFAGKGETLVYERFAPADAILGGQSLEDWTRRVYSLDARGRIERLELDKNPAALFVVGGIKSPAAYAATRLLTMLSRQKSFVRGLVRHLPEKNRLLCITARGMKPMDMEKLLGLGKNYGIL